ncbi:Rne/Rng family ribonuclease [Peptacetobacter sp.]|uniref:Rne/Rng family ribonuclease n=1 Tax=Peptacetobacter sp. TaxID=2991975 RepID=UPI002622AF6B|nr:Rne/Rng family ribonuclease [Peptacetobacter sp.]
MLLLKKIIIELLEASQKTAILEDGKLKEIYIDNMIEKSIVSNIYRGKVQKVLSGMDACFVDIGREKNGYLKLNKESNLKTGDDVIVQVIKDEIGTKGAKLTQEISFSGRYLVYIPSNKRVTMSNKIVDEKERLRLKRLFYSNCKNETGYIIRTEAQGCSMNDFKNDIKELNAAYSNVEIEFKRGKGPKLLYTNSDSAIKYIRDNISNEFENIIINDEKKYNYIKELLKDINRDYMDILKLEKNIDVFDVYGVEKQLNRYLSKKVWLKNGGYLIIEKTEALTVIDVNSGKFTGNLDLAKTAMKINEEAAKEIVNQIIIRDIAGIIIVDFIDDNILNTSKKKLVNIMKEELKRDKRKSEVKGMTSLGLMEISRRREKEELESYFSTDCFRCGSKYGEASNNAILDSIEKKIMNITRNTVYRKVKIIFNDNIKEKIINSYMNVIKQIGLKYKVEIEISSSPNIKEFIVDLVK